MTQTNVWLTILSLTKRYRTDLLSHKLRRLCIKFYTDTIFSDDTSIQGHKGNIVVSNQPPVNKSVMNTNTL